MANEKLDKAMGYASLDAYLEKALGLNKKPRKYHTVIEYADQNTHVQNAHATLARLRGNPRTNKQRKEFAEANAIIENDFRYPSINKDIQ